MNVIPTPDPTRVPCSEDCAHLDCVSARTVAAARCAVCDNPIGYDRPFYRYTTGWAGPVAHHTCTTRRHDIGCVDDEGVPDLCVCGLDTPDLADRYNPDDREPAGGDPYWQDEPA